MKSEAAHELRIIHTDEYDPSINSLFVPAIYSRGLLFVSGVTAAPMYHDHPHRPEDFVGIPSDAEAQARIAFDHLDRVLEAAGSARDAIIMLTRFFTNVGTDQDAVNRVQGEYLGDHRPTSTSVEVQRLATDPGLRLEIQAIAAAPGSSVPGGAF